jgi:hypothetical protein
LPLTTSSQYHQSPPTFSDPFTNASISITNPQTQPRVPQTRAKDRTLFNATVLELVKLIQAALAISGLFPLYPYANFVHREHRHHHHRHHHRGGMGGVEIDGLLCDITVEGIQKWVSEIGESCVGVEVILHGLRDSICGADAG